MKKKSSISVAMSVPTSRMLPGVSNKSQCLPPPSSREPSCWRFLVAISGNTSHAHIFGNEWRKEISMYSILSTQYGTEHVSKVASIAKILEISNTHLGETLKVPTSMQHLLYQQITNSFDRHC